MASAAGVLGVIAALLLVTGTGVCAVARPSATCCGSDAQWTGFFMILGAAGVGLLALIVAVIESLTKRRRSERR